MKGGIALSGGVMGLVIGKKAESGELLDFRRQELQGVESKIQKLELPEDVNVYSEDQQILLAEKAVLDTSIDFLEENQEFLKQQVTDIRDGGRFIQHMVLKVNDLDKEVKFWTKGYGMKVVRQRTVNGVRTAFVANSPESLQTEEGGSFALELVESKNPVNVGNGLAYIQLRVGDTPRLSEILKANGRVDFAYGWLQTRSPTGYRINLYVEKARRDPFECIALRVKNVDQAADYYQNCLGMRKVEMKEREKYVDAFGPLYGLGGLFKKEFERDDMLTPRPPKESVYLTYGKNENNTMGVLLLPQNKDLNIGALEISKNTPIDVGNGFSKLAILSNDVYKEKATMESYKNNNAGLTYGFTGEVPGIGTKVSVFTDADGYSGVWVDYDDFEKEQPKPSKPTSLVEEFEEAMAQANSELKALREKEKKDAEAEEYEALGDAVRGEGYANV